MGMTLKNCEFGLRPMIVFKRIPLCIYKAVLHHIVSNARSVPAMGCLPQV